MLFKILKDKKYIQCSEFRPNSVFQGKHKLLKNSECKNYIQCSENFQGKFCFSGQAQVVQNSEGYIQYSEFSTHFVFQGKHKLLKHPECRKYIKYSEKLHDKLCFQGKHKFLKNPER